jgi:hypothetical protein
VALSRYVLTATVTVPAGTAATVVAGEPATGGAAGYGSVSTTSGPTWPVTYLKGTPIILDPAGALYAAIGAGNLRPYQQGTDDVSHAAISNLLLSERQLLIGDRSPGASLSPQASERPAS